MATVYVLKDPITKDVMYVGQTSRPLSIRLSKHCTEKLKHSHSKNDWIEELLSFGMRPLIEPIEEVEKEKALEREDYWIKHFQIINPLLLNIGGGRPGLYDERTVGVAIKVPVTKIKEYRQEVKKILKQWEVKPTAPAKKKAPPKKKKK